MRYTVKLLPGNQVLQADEGALLSDVLRETGVNFPCGGKGICGNCLVELLDGDICMDKRHRELMSRKQRLSGQWRLACFSRVMSDLVLRIPWREDAILADQDSVQLYHESGDSIAVDVGSTTVVAQLIDRRSGKVLSSVAESNCQSQKGADVISRIAYAIEKEEHAEELMTLIRRQIGNMIDTLLHNGGREEVRQITLVGNSVMHHLFAGLDVKPFAAYPFQSNTQGLQSFSAESLGWNVPSACKILFLPNLSHFVGSDLLAGIYHLQIHKQNKWQALLDLGTNGEIVIGNREKIFCTSTAAGPAFEGVNITQGMRAVNGAIYKVETDNGQVSVIGDTSADGICGSGLVDAIHYFLRQGYIDCSGALCEEEQSELALTDKVAVYDRDVREFQLAKAAIATGFQLLLNKAGLQLTDLEHIYIAGGLGTFLDIEKAMEIGLLKAVSKSQIRQEGNTALKGCRELTYSQALQEIPEILTLITHHALESDSRFQDVYCDNLFF